MWWALPLPRASHGGAYTHAGPEIGVACYKSIYGTAGSIHHDRIENWQQKGTIDR